MSWRLPPRSRRWRWTFPELAWSGATPLWRASWASVLNRSTGPISASSFAAVRAPQPGHLEQRWGDLLGTLLEFVVELGDHLVHRATADHEFAGDPHLDGVGVTAEPAADPFEVRGAPEHPQRDGKRRIELMEVPAEPLLHPPAFVDEIVAVINQELHVPVGLLVRARPT